MGGKWWLLDYLSYSSGTVTFQAILNADGKTPDSIKSQLNFILIYFMYNKRT